MLRWLFSLISAVVLTTTLLCLEDMYSMWVIWQGVFFAQESFFETRI